MSTDIANCPFCGSAPVMQTDGESGYWIECTNSACGSSTNMRIALMDDVKPLLIEQWNRRTAPPVAAVLSDAAHPELTPMFLANAAMCIESPGDVQTSVKRNILAKLLRISAELQDAKMARIKAKAGESAS